MAAVVLLGAERLLRLLRLLLRLLRLLLRLSLLRLWLLSLALLRVLLLALLRLGNAVVVNAVVVTFVPLVGACVAPSSPAARLDGDEPVFVRPAAASVVRRPCGRACAGGCVAGLWNKRASKGAQPGRPRAFSHNAGGGVGVVTHDEKKPLLRVFTDTIGTYTRAQAACRGGTPRWSPPR